MLYAKNELNTEQVFVIIVVKFIMLVTIYKIMLNILIIISFISLSILTMIAIIGGLFWYVFEHQYASIWLICFITFIFSMVKKNG